MVRGLVAEQQIKNPSYSMSTVTGDDYDAAREADLCRHDLIEMSQADWIKAYRRIVRRNYDANTVAELLANSFDLTECIALSLRYAEQNPSDYLFKRGCELAQTSTIGQLESALYLVEEREEFISLVLAVIHYDLFNSFELGQYVVRVELIIEGGRCCRRWTNP